ncbi:ABC transporter permease [Herbidospora cretacea]|uniref:ABC transporter permease n=1 Tax=Herbidospora cretacea TaxID=28444 RepID=UPI0009ED09DE|nr:ABC transporter permease [Herbidospora cretacea]
MTATLSAPESVEETPLPPAPEVRSSPLRTFGSVLWRDLFVMAREPFDFLAQSIVQPFFMLFIFGMVLAEVGFTGDNFAAILLPGIIALNALLGGVYATSLPLVFDLAITREIEDRLMAPLPIWAVALEKILFGGLRGTLAALVMVPFGFLLFPGVSWPVEGLAPAFGVLFAGAVAGAAIGLAIGTSVAPKRIEIMFAVLLTPIAFTGSTQYPWHSIADLEWFQWVSAANPLTYVSEGMRAVLVPDVTSIALWIDLSVLGGCCLLFAVIGVVGFLRRARD